MTGCYLGALSVLVPGAFYNWNGGGVPRTKTISQNDAMPDLLPALRGVKHRYFNDLSRYCVASARVCTNVGQEAASHDWHRTPEERRGVIIGTTVADYGERRRVDDTLAREGVGALNTITAPNVSVNIASAYVAIECRTRALATTLTSPFLSALEGLAIGFLSLSAGYADALLVIGAEERIPAPDAPQVIGAVCWLLQRNPALSGRVILDVCMGCHTGGTDCSAEKDACRFLSARAAEYGRTCGAGEFAVIRDSSADARATAQAWTRQAAQAGLLVTERNELIVDDAGSVAPFLAAVPVLAESGVALLLAIFRNRYVAFAIV